MELNKLLTTTTSHFSGCGTHKYLLHHMEAGSTLLLMVESFMKLLLLNQKLEFWILDWISIDIQDVLQWY